MLALSQNRIAKISNIYSCYLYRLFLHVHTEFRPLRDAKNRLLFIFFPLLVLQEEILQRCFPILGPTNFRSLYVIQNKMGIGNSENIDNLCLGYSKSWTMHTIPHKKIGCPSASKGYEPLLTIKSPCCNWCGCPSPYKIQRAASSADGVLGLLWPKISQKQKSLFSALQ